MWDDTVGNFSYDHHRVLACNQNVCPGEELTSKLGHVRRGLEVAELLLSATGEGGTEASVLANDGCDG